MRPAAIVHLAARVGGIQANQKYPADFFYRNIVMGVHLMEEARQAGVRKFLTAGTVCSYPKYTPAPFKESSLWDGYPEETNAPYGLAKKMLLVQGQAYRQQYGFNAVYVIPVNMYGPGDDFDPEHSHVIPALIRRFVEARLKKIPRIVVWGDGSASREFLYAGDCADALRLTLETYNKPEPMNIGTGREIRIKELAEMIREMTGYQGRVVWDKSKPNGQPRRHLDVSRAKREIGFTAKTRFETGLKLTVDWYVQSLSEKGLLKGF
jgi:GDP-L-fucose synthase